MYVLAKFLTNFADSGQAALAESPDQGLQYLPIYWTNLLRLKCLPKLIVPNLPNMYMLAKFLTNFADADQVAVAESSDHGLQCLPIYYTYLLHLECLLTLAVPNLLNICLLAEFMTYVADSGQVGVAESYD